VVRGVPTRASSDKEKAPAANPLRSLLDGRPIVEQPF
jgi:hypothetical protein